MSTPAVYRCRHCGMPHVYMTLAVLCELWHECSAAYSCYDTGGSL